MWHVTQNMHPYITNYTEPRGCAHYWSHARTQTRWSNSRFTSGIPSSPETCAFWMGRWGRITCNIYFYSSFCLPQLQLNCHNLNTYMTQLHSKWLAEVTRLVAAISGPYVYGIMKKLMKGVDFERQSVKIPELGVKTPLFNIHIWCLKTTEPWSIYPTTQFELSYLQNEANITNLLLIVCYMD